MRRSLELGSQGVVPQGRINNGYSDRVPHTKVYSLGLHGVIAAGHSHFCGRSPWISR